MGRRPSCPTQACHPVPDGLGVIMSPRRGGSVKAWRALTSILESLHDRDSAGPTRRLLHGLRCHGGTSPLGCGDDREERTVCAVSAACEYWDLGSGFWPIFRDRIWPVRSPVSELTVLPTIGVLP